MFSTLIAFALGYALGMRAGREGLEEIRQAAVDLAASPQVQDLLASGAELLNEVAKAGRAVDRQAGPAGGTGSRDAPPGR